MPSAKRAGKRARFGLLCLFGFLILVGFLINPPKSSSPTLQHTVTTSVNVRQGGSYLEDGRKQSYTATQGSSGAIANIGGESGSLVVVVVVLVVVVVMMMMMAAAAVAVPVDRRERDCFETCSKMASAEILL